MKIVTAANLAWGLVLCGALGSVRPLHAQVGLGTWVRKSDVSGTGMTMTVEACCNGGRRLIYHIGSNASATTLTVESRFDGSEAPVLIAGKPSGETMAIKRVDDRHLATVVKMNRMAFGISKATISADGRTLTVINDITSAVGGQPIGKTTEIWVRK